MKPKTLSIVNSDALVAVLGPCDRHVRMIRKALDVRITARDNRIEVAGESEAVGQAMEVLERLQETVARHGSILTADVQRTLEEVQAGVSRPDTEPIEVYSGRKIVPRTVGQAKYVDTIRSHDIVFCRGPAGTGKTYLAVALAVAALKQQEIRKIVLVRPAVEAGESLGYLPGDLQAKINPYLRPLLDALHEMVDHDTIRRFTEEERIEVLPLAYMRGRTLNEAFMILDEAQNTTVGQMKMFLTRMGAKSRVVVSGDTTQIDLPERSKSGLIDAWHRLGSIEGIGQVELTGRDIVRHPLVQAIVDAYEEPAQHAPGRKR